MDEELHPLQEILGGNDYQNFQAPTQDNTIRIAPPEIKHP